MDLLPIARLRRPVSISTLRLVPTRSILYLRPYHACARPFPARLACGPTAIVDRRPVAAGSGCPRPGRPLWGRSALEHLDRPHLSDGGGGISRRRGPGTLENTRIASGRRRIPHVQIWGGAAVFLSNDHSRTTTVGAARVRAIFWVRPWRGGCGRTTAAAVVRRLAGDIS
jgi:hypothetical protein